MKKEDYFRSFFENTSTAMVFLDKAWECVAANRAFGKIADSLPEKLQGESFLKYAHPEDLQAVRENLEELLTGKSDTITFENRFCWKEKEISSARIHATLIQDGNEKPEVIAIHVFDLTDMKKVEVQLQENLERHKFFSEVAVLYNGLADLQVTTLQVLSTTRRYLEVDRVVLYEIDSSGQGIQNTYEVCGPGASKEKNNPFSFIEESEVPIWSARLQRNRHIEVPGSESGDQGLTDFLQARKTVSFLAYPLFVQNRLFGFVAFDDCTGRNEWRKEENDLLQTLSIIISNAFERSRDRFDILEEREYAASLAEFSQDLLSVDMTEKDLISQTLKLALDRIGAAYGAMDFVGVKEQNQEMFRVEKIESSNTQGCLSSNKSSEGTLASEAIPFCNYSVTSPLPVIMNEEELFSPGPFHCWLEPSNRLSVPIRMDDRIIGQIVLCSRPGGFQKKHTEFVRNLISLFVFALLRKRYEEEIIEARKEAENGNRARTNFLASMSHEIRTPLNSIQGFSQILLDRLQGTEFVPFLRTIQKNGTILLNLMNDLLDLSRIEEGKMSIRPVPTNIPSLLYEMKEIYSFDSLNKNLTFRVEVDEKIPSALLLDKLRLQQILMNIIGNAIKFTGEGGVVLACKLRKRHENTADITITVQDTGVGIDPEHIPRIFEPFHQYDEGNSRKFGGTGLGLSISSRLVERMGGMVQVISEPGKGSRFSIHMMDLPVVETESNEKNGTSEREEIKLAPGKKLEFPPSGKKKDSEISIAAEKEGADTIRKEYMQMYRSRVKELKQRMILGEIQEFVDEALVVAKDRELEEFERFLHDTSRCAEEFDFPGLERLLDWFLKVSEKS